MQDRQTQSDIRVLALDLDDTLLRSDSTISRETLDSLLQWRALGHHVVIATGRPPRAIEEVLPPQLHDTPWICYNGAQVLEKGETIFEDLIPTGDVREILSWAQVNLPQWRMGVEIDNQLFMNRPPDQPKQYQHAPDLLAVATRPAAKILFFDAADDHLARGQLESFSAFESLLAHLPASTRPMHSSRYRLLQLLSCSADKAEALSFTVGRWNLSLTHVMAFGDDVNDVEMVRQSGSGVAVANAVPEVLAVADRITGTNDEDGVAAVLRNLMSI